MPRFIKYYIQLELENFFTVYGHISQYKKWAFKYFSTLTENTYFIRCWCRWFLCYRNLIVFENSSYMGGATSDIYIYPLLFLVSRPLFVSVIFFVIPQGTSNVICEFYTIAASSSKSSHPLQPISTVHRQLSFFNYSIFNSFSALFSIINLLYTIFQYRLGRVIFSCL